MVVPIFAPIITPADCLKLINPAFTKLTVITVVTEEDCTIEVELNPVRIPLNRLDVIEPSIFFNFSLVGADKLAQFSKLIKDWKITNIDYSEVMKAHGSSDTFVFLDPPYDIKDFLYGKNREMHKKFDHDRFADDVYNCIHKFMITYNVNERLLELYKNYNLKEWKLRYSMAHRGDKGTNENIKTELLVTNYKTEPNTLYDIIGGL